MSRYGKTAVHVEVVPGDEARFVAQQEEHGAGDFVGCTDPSQRDEVLSYIGHSPPGELTWSSPFIGRLVAYIGVPLLTFLVAQISWLRTLFVEVVTPLLMGLR